MTACRPNGSSPDVDISTPAPTSKSTTTPTPEPTPTPAPYTIVTVDSQLVNDGELVLVNWAHEYENTDTASTVLAAEYAGDHLLLESDQARLSSDALEALNSLADGFFEVTGGDRLFVTSGYRTVEYQAWLYADYVEANGEELAKIYVADPGYSEHHTGLAVDLSTMSAAGERVALVNHELAAWLNTNCARFGFILRYPVGKTELTHIAYEPWHFRYLGLANALAVAGLDITYEEYVEHIRQYSIETGMLHVTPMRDDGSMAGDAVDGAGLALLDVAMLGGIPDEGYLIYYVTASETGVTEVRIPVEAESYSISGDNDGGFIITVTL
ncbi:MAG: M15 family metallopeptidase [Christensenellaceae bacterium]|nr:M15 family metallopeptidase [Christensenellaceae bacterium]